MNEAAVTATMNYLQTVAQNSALRRPIRRHAERTIEAIHSMLRIADGSYVRGHMDGVGAAAGRIQDLLDANNRYLERARASEEEAKRLRRVLHAIDEMSAGKSEDPQLHRIRDLALHALAGGDIVIWPNAEG